MKYRLQYRDSCYVGIYRSGDTGWEHRDHIQIIEETSDEAAKNESAKIIGGLASRTLTHLVRIDQEEISTKIL